MQTQFERGVPGIELPQVMLEMQKASVSFRAITEVRNKFVDAYQDDHEYADLAPAARWRLGDWAMGDWQLRHETKN